MPHSSDTQYIDFEFIRHLKSTVWALRGLCFSADPVLLALTEPYKCCVADRRISNSPGSDEGGDMGSQRETES